MSDGRTNKNDNRNPDEIEKDLEGTREQLADDLEDLSRKVSPKNLKDEAIGSMDEAKEAAMDRVESMTDDVTQRTEAAGERLVEGVRENPMPLALVLGALGAGYALMQARKRGSERDFDFDDRMYDERMGSSANTMNRGGATGASGRAGYDYRSGDGDDEGNFLQKNGLLVGLGALAAGAVVGTLVSTSPETARKGRERFEEARHKLGEATGRMTERFTGGGDKDDGEGIQVRERIRVNKSADELYRFWRDFENLPKIMSHLEKVTTKDGKRSHWVAKGPLNTSVEWDAVITDERPNDSIAWRAVSDADVPNEGSVKFRRVGMNSTDIIVSLTYHPPGGKVGESIAKLFGEEPSQQVSDDLEKFKEAVEAGRITLGSTTTMGTRNAGPTV